MKKIEINFRYILFSIFGAVLIGTLGFLLFQNMKTTNAANMGGFWAGNIMSDEVMSDYNSMSEGEIQNWLNVNNPCNNYDRALYEEQSRLYPNVKWHFTDHFICMSEERFGNGTVIGSGDTAAHIIWQVSQEYKINPKVLLVLLQKENGLVTDNFPHSGQYKTATGFGCPDTAPCEEKYYGFKNQLRNAAGLFREVLNGGWSNYPAYQDNYVQYNPNAGCGGTNVYIENYATSALYRYTPYQPNGAALATDYGTGDACSAYGNRNFYSYYTDWFGDIHNAGPQGTAIRLVEGTYTISSKVNVGRKIDLTDKSMADGTRLQLWDKYDNNQAQEWQIIDAGDGFYRIKSPVSGKLVDLKWAETKNGTPIQQYTENDTCSQKWKPIRTPDGYITFVSACSSSVVIDLPNAKATNGNKLHIWRANNSDAQKWKLVPLDNLSDGTYTIASKLGDQQVMEIAGGLTQDGANVQTWHENKTAAQEWTIIRNKSTGYYRIYNPHSQKSLDLRWGETNNGTNIYQWSNNNSCSQEWGILNTADGYTFISSCHAGKVIDIKSAGTKDGTNIQLYESNNSAAQKWDIRLASAAPTGVFRVTSGLNTQKTIDVTWGSKEEGTKLQIWDRGENNLAQEWKIAQSGNGYYKLTNPNSGKNLDLHFGDTTNNTPIDQWSDNDGCAQKWHFMKLSDQKYTIESACNRNKVIDLRWGDIANGTPIQIYDNNRTTAQSWILK